MSIREAAKESRAEGKLAFEGQFRMNTMVRQMGYSVYGGKTKVNSSMPE